VQSVDLRSIFNKLAVGGAGACEAHSEGEAMPIVCLVLASDGVWDNWTYEDVTRFMMDASCLGAVRVGADGAHRVTLSFMQRNALYAKRNFGSQADNATGIIMYISPSKQFPVDENI
jgi:serine/threonine protein phosphatase PrpC